MKTRRAFTPTELMFSIGILVLLISILLPSMARARELSKRTVCSSNLRGIGQACYIYAQEGDLFPVLAESRSDGAVTYWAYRKKRPPADAPPSPTADLWMLVRSNNTTPKQFMCPSTIDVPDPAQDTLAYFDFASGVNLSYAYQYMHNEKRPAIGPMDDPTLPLLADANPYIKGGIRARPASDRKSAARGNSANHTDREGQNILFVDGHVDFLKAPDAGVSGTSEVPAPSGPRYRDNIYTVHRKGEAVDPGTTDGFPNRLDLGDASDSCLVP